MAENSWSAVVLTVSDRCSRGEAEDKSGPGLEGRLTELGWSVTRDVVDDDEGRIEEKLLHYVDERHVQLVLTTGGTGFTPRDVTPEATQRVIKKECPGLVIAMVTASLQVTPHAMLARPKAGIRERTLIVNLPGSSKGSLENFEAIVPALPHAIRLINQGAAPTPSGEHKHSSEK